MQRGSTIKHLRNLQQFLQKIEIVVRLLQPHMKPKFRQETHSELRTHASLHKILFQHICLLLLAFPLFTRMCFCYILRLLDFSIIVHLKTG